MSLANTITIHDSQFIQAVKANFLNHGTWDDSLLNDCVKSAVIAKIYAESAKSGKPVFCIIDDTNQRYYVFRYEGK